MFSLYVSAFNIECGMFDWKDTLDKFSNFATELVVGTTNDSKDNTINLLKDYVDSKDNVKLVETDYRLDSALFDGQIKDAALQETTQPGKILLDLDEIIPLSQKNLWIKYFNILQKSPDIDGFLIPSINLCGSMNTYKDIGYKFYLHKDGLKRGVWKYAINKDESIDIMKSDTTEPLDKFGNLGKFSMLPNNIETLRTGEVPYVFHKWAVDVDKRIEQNKFWKPVWENRARKEVSNIVLDKKNIENIEVLEHNLPLE
jgi:hypothetical protein